MTACVGGEKRQCFCYEGRNSHHRYRELVPCPVKVSVKSQLICDNIAKSERKRINVGEKTQHGGVHSLQLSSITFKGKYSRIIVSWLQLG